jgi:hypothetical protein
MFVYAIFVLHVYSGLTLCKNILSEHYKKPQHFEDVIVIWKLIALLQHIYYLNSLRFWLFY